MQLIRVVAMDNALNWELALISVFVIDIIRELIVAHFYQRVTLLLAPMVGTVHWMHRTIMYVHVQPDTRQEDVKLK